MTFVLLRLQISAGMIPDHNCKLLQVVGSGARIWKHFHHRLKEHANYAVGLLTYEHGFNDDIESIS
jgi:hypothetical protein